MSVKILGIIIILSCGAYATRRVKKSYEKRIKTLDIFLNDWEFILSSISFLKEPVIKIISSLADGREKEFKDFYNSVLNYYSKWDDAILNDAVNSDALWLKKKDKEIISEFFKNLGEKDYENQINYLKHKMTLLKSLINDAKDNQNKNEKAGCTLTMCCFLALIILFI